MPRSVPAPATSMVAYDGWHCTRCSDPTRRRADPSPPVASHTESPYRHAQTPHHCSPPADALVRGRQLGTPTLRRDLRRVRGAKWAPRTPPGQPRLGLRGWPPGVPLHTVHTAAAAAAALVVQVVRVGAAVSQRDRTPDDHRVLKVERMQEGLTRAVLHEMRNRKA